MTYIIIMMLASLLAIFLGEILVKNFNIEVTTVLKIILIFIAFVDVTLIVNILYGYTKSKSSNQCVHVIGKFGSGKTYFVMNNTLNYLFTKSTTEEITIKQRIKNQFSLEEEYVSKVDKKDVLYISALGKNQKELFYELNTELSFGVDKVFFSVLKLKKLVNENMISKLDHKIKRRNINTIIIDDIERMCDQNHDVEINAIINLIIKLKKNYNIIIISSSNTSIMTKLKGVPMLDSLSGNSRVSKHDVTINNFESQNFNIKFSKIGFTRVYHIKSNYVRTSSALEEIINQFNEYLKKLTDLHSIKCDFYKNSTLESILDGTIAGDYRVLKLCLQEALDKLQTYEDIVIACAYVYGDVDTLLNYYLAMFDIIIPNHPHTIHYPKIELEKYIKRYESEPRVEVKKELELLYKDMMSHV